MELVDHRGRTIQAQESGGNGFTRDDISALYSEIVKIAEASGLSSSGVLDLAVDAQGWEELGGDRLAGMSPTARREMVRRSRLSAVHDPLSVATLRIWRNFIIGRGITVKAKEESTQTAVDAFWNAPRNRSMFSTEGLRDNVDILNQDGELIFAVFTGDRYGGTTVRQLDSLEITGVVTSPDDLKMPLGYTREYTDTNNKLHKLFYWDMFAPEELRAGATESIPSEFEEQKNVVVRFVAGNTRWQRGNPLLTPALAWSQRFRKFMEARHAIQLAMAEFVVLHKVQGGIQAVSRAVSYHQSGLVGGGTRDNPPATPGSVWVEGEGSDRSTIKQETGASGAQVDGDMLLQVFGVGVNLPPHYLGSGKSAGNLSVATTMELPILKGFQAEQDLYRAVYDDLIQYEFEQVSVPEDKRGIEVDFPEIVIKDVPALMQGLSNAVQVAPRLVGSEPIEMFVLSAFGIQDPAEVIQRLNDEGPEPEDGEGKEAEVVRALRTLRDLAADLKESVA